jgi:hypothetical protein
MLLYENAGYADSHKFSSIQLSSIPLGFAPPLFQVREGVAAADPAQCWSETPPSPSTIKLD